MSDNDASSFSVVSLGCARTLVDTEKMVDQLQQVGLQLTAEGTGETVTILNTCSFIQAAIDETEENIRQLIERKTKGQINYVVVAGCYPSRFKIDDLAETFPDVDLWVSTKDERHIQQLITKLIFKRRFQPVSSIPYVKLTPSHFAYLKISEGCNNWCSFCTIPRIRGTHQSMSIDDIVKEAEMQMAFGAKELVVIAEDTTAWGDDIFGQPSYPILLERLAQLPIDWIRSMYIYPSRVDDELIRVINQYDAICNYVDMPIQHVNNRLLERMMRRHDKAHLESVMDRFFSAIPNFSWRSTFILGFPGETEDDVDELIEFIERYPITQLGCFPYSEESGTRAARFDDPIPPDVIQNRIQRVMTAQYDLVQKRHHALIGSTLRVLYEGNGQARSYRDAPDVDGCVRINNCEHMTPGTFYDVQVQDIKNYDLLAEPIMKSH